MRRASETTHTGHRKICPRRCPLPPPYDSTARVRVEEKDRNYTRGCVARKEGVTCRDARSSKRTKKEKSPLAAGGWAEGERVAETRSARERKDRVVEEERRKARRLRESWKT